MTNLYLIRHAESVANADNLLAGRIDYPLSATGKLDASAIAEEFSAAVAVDLIWCSPLLRASGLPPFSHLALLRADAQQPGQAEGFLDTACTQAELLLTALDCHGIELLGPVPAPMERRAGRHRAQLLLQASNRGSLHRLLTPWLQTLEQLPGSRSVRWSLDVDPIDLF